MNYLYHHVPRDMQGSTLYPLNMLKTKLPIVYESEHSKYRGREYVTKQHIPPLGNCLWNDVLFLTAVNPQELIQARREAGWSDIQPQQYYKINPAVLDQSQLAVYLFKPTSLSKELLVDDFTIYDYNDLSKYSHIPQETEAYFKQEFEEGKSRIQLFYRYIPHILYKGEIDVTNVEIIRVS
jgi:hypothetical protein